MVLIPLMNPKVFTLKFILPITFLLISFGFEMKFTEHLSPLLAQIKKLGETLGVIEFEQQWLEAQTERQAKGIVHLLTHLIYNLFLCIN